MLGLAFVLLLIAAIGGGAIAALDLATPPVRLGHGGLAGLGLVILLLGALAHPAVLVWTAFGLLLAGFAAGAVFFGVLWRDSAPPRLLIVGHGIINTVGVVLLGLDVFI